MKCKGALLRCHGCGTDYDRGELDPDGTCGLCGYNRARTFPVADKAIKRRDAERERRKKARAT